MPKTGTIVGFGGSWGSGLAFLQLDTDEGLVSIPADNGPLARALRHMFGDEVYGEAHSINQAAIVGKQVVWDYDDMGLCLGYLAPAE